MNNSIILELRYYLMKIMERYSTLIHPVAVLWIASHDLHQQFQGFMCILSDKLRLKWGKIFNLNVSIYSSYYWATSSAEEDCVMQSKAPEQLLSGPYGEIVFVSCICGDPVRPL